MDKLVIHINMESFRILCLRIEMQIEKFDAKQLQWLLN